MAVASTTVLTMFGDTTGQTPLFNVGNTVGQNDQVLVRKGSLISSNQNITNSEVALGSTQIYTYGAKKLILDLGITAGTSTNIDINLKGGATSAGTYTTKYTTKTVEADLTTRSEAENRLQSGNINHYLDFEISRVPEYLEVYINDSNGGTGVVTRANFYLIY